MPEESELESLQHAVGAARAGWTVGSTSMLHLEPEDRRARLGVIIDREDLQQRREQPAPDITELAARAILDPAARDQEEAVETARLGVKATAELAEITAQVLPSRVNPYPLSL